MNYSQPNLLPRLLETIYNNYKQILDNAKQQAAAPITPVAPSPPATATLNALNIAQNAIIQYQIDITALRQQIARYAPKNKDLKKKVNLLKKMQQLLYKLHDKKNNIITKKELLISFLNILIEQYKSQINELTAIINLSDDKSRILTLQTQLEQITINYNNLRIKSDADDVNIGALNNMITDLKAQIEIMDIELKAASELDTKRINHIKALRDDLSAAKKRDDEYNKIKQELETKINAVETALDEYIFALTQIKSQNDTMVNKNEQLIFELDVTKNKLNAVNREIEINRVELNKLQKDLDTAVKNCSEFARKLQEKDFEIIELNNNLTRAKQDINKLETFKDQLIKKEKQYLLDAKTNETKITQLQQAIDEANLTISNQNAIITQLEQQKKELESQIEILKEDNKKISELETKLIKLRDELTQPVMQQLQQPINNNIPCDYPDLRQDNERLIQKVHDLQNDLNNAVTAPSPQLAKCEKVVNKLIEVIRKYDRSFDPNTYFIAQRLKRCADLVNKYNINKVRNDPKDINWENNPDEDYYTKKCYNDNPKYQESKKMIDNIEGRCYDYNLRVGNTSYQDMKQWLKADVNKTNEYYENIKKCFNQHNKYPIIFENYNRDLTDNLFSIKNLYAASSSSSSSSSAFSLDDLYRMYTHLQNANVSEKYFVVGEKNLSKIIQHNQNKIYEQVLHQLDNQIDCNKENFSLDLYKVNIGGTAFAYSTLR